jgi:uncharacterized coiled-coil protein SlyX
MAAADKKSTYTAAEVAELIRPLADTIAKQKAEIDELKRKLEHMNEVFANAQRAQFGQSSEKNSYVLHDQASFSMRRKRSKPPKRRSRLRIPFWFPSMSGRRNAARPRC